jgi:hypothetical protein
LVQSSRQCDRTYDDISPESPGALSARLRLVVLCWRRSSVAYWRSDMTKPRARPDYSPELAHEICRRLTVGEILQVICRQEGMPAESSVRL